jgi:hypothetical protein
MRSSVALLSPIRRFGSLLILALPGLAYSDGLPTDKIYHPYVNPIEREIELRSTYLIDDDPLLDGDQLTRLGFAHALSDRLRGEVYVIGSNTAATDFKLTAYELELKWQLTEQGEYFADWGLLFELETEREENITEFVTTVLIEKQLGAFAATLNLAAAYEWGDDISDEFETELAGQLRYRYARLFEPGVELYVGQEAKGAGPVVIGEFRMGVGRKLRWEAGTIFALDSVSPDITLRGMLEYEF